VNGTCDEKVVKQITTEASQFFCRVGLVFQVFGTHKGCRYMSGRYVFVAAPLWVPNAKYSHIVAPM
jgi:hypothetical protein